MKLLCALILVVVTMTAAPTLEQDGVPVPADHPGLGALVHAVPGSEWEMWWNDNIDGGDFDFSDLKLGVTIDEDIAAGFVSGNVRVLGALSAHHNIGYYLLWGLVPLEIDPVDGLSFLAAVNQPVRFAMWDSNDSEFLRDGWHGSNVYALTQRVDMTATPEPGSVFLLAGGIAVLIARRMRRCDPSSL